MTSIEHRMRNRTILGFVFMLSGFGAVAAGWPLTALALDMIALWFFVAVLTGERE